MSPMLRQIVAVLFVIACIAGTVFFVSRGVNQGAGIGAAIGAVVVLIMNNRARKGRVE